MKATITLSPDEVKEACLLYIKKHNYTAKTKDVKLVVKSGNKCVGYGPNELDVPYADFTGATIEVETTTAHHVLEYPPGVRGDQRSRSNSPIFNAGE